MFSVTFNKLSLINQWYGLWSREYPNVPCKIIYMYMYAIEASSKRK